MNRSQRVPQAEATELQSIGLRRSQKRTSTRPIVIGYGNPLRQDDAIGWRAAELVERSLPAQAVDVIQCHQLTPELAEKLGSASLVLFLDAAADEDPGRICFQPVRAQEPGVWTHYLVPGQLLGLAQQLQDEAPPAFLISGGALQMGMGDTMTNNAEQCAERMAALAVRLVTASA